MTVVLGVDGCPGGWCCATIHVDGRDCRVVDTRIFRTFGEILATKAKVICVDIPIGLLDGKGQRKCDEEARSRLKEAWQRVFWPPLRQVIKNSELADFMSGMRTSQAERIRLHRIGCDITQKITGHRLSSIQVFSISPKINEVDNSTSPVFQRLRHVPHVCEVHPELCFWALNNRSPVVPNKKDAEGKAKRWALLRRVLPDLPPQPPQLPWPKKTCRPDDYIDALVCAWTAVCVSHGDAHPIPAEPQTNARGLRMEMWLPGTANQQPRTTSGE